MRIDFSQLSDLQTNNLSSAIKAYHEESLVSSTHPCVLYLELTRNCVSNCSFCRGTSWTNNPKYNMPKETFKLIQEEYIPKAVMVDLRGWGESLLLDDFANYVQKVAKYNSKIILTTTLGCGSEESLQSIIDHDVFLTVSFDAIDKTVYEKIRTGVSYDTVIKNIKFITRGLLKKHGTLKDKIRLAIVPLQSKNLNQLEKVILFAHQNQITEILIGPLFAGKNCPYLLEKHEKKTISTIEKSLDLAEKLNVNLQFAHSLTNSLKTKEKTFDLCCHPWIQTAISYDGTMSLCEHCVDPIAASESSIGNILNNPTDLWNGNAAKKIRLAHLNKNWKDLIPRCKLCYKNGRYAVFEQEISEDFRKWRVDQNDIKKALQKRNKLFYSLNKFFRKHN
ncbi:MAG: radical SAM protein [Candidatus Omnitrophica bacterium]|nr:radical SAM protein [Candidatus Omnitrophota bacterium]